MSALGSWTKADPLYFLGAYFPTLIVIMFSIWWKCIFARLKEMEAFYQLTQVGRAEAKDSLLLSYSTVMLPVLLVKSLRSKHWLAFVGAFNMSLTTVCTLYAAETLHLKGVGEGCGVIVDAEGEYNEGFEMLLAMQPALGFVLGAVLLAVFCRTLQLFKIIPTSNGPVRRGNKCRWHRIPLYFLHGLEPMVSTE